LDDGCWMLGLDVGCWMLDASIENLVSRI